MGEETGNANETALIQRYLAPLAAGFPGAFGLTDDAALLSPGPDTGLVVTTDGMIEGVHFFPGEAPGFKALAVNISDLAAKGAKPAAYLLTLALPAPPDEEWLNRFALGLARAQALFGCHLIGGDTSRTPGPLSIGITALGWVPKSTIVRRSGAKAGDTVFVTGTIGDAALGLRLRQNPFLPESWALGAQHKSFLELRFSEPEPRLAIAEALRRHATAAIDVSDGLILDLERLCRASGAGARIDVANVPVSVACQSVIEARGTTMSEVISGGEDYEILLSVPPERKDAFCSEAATADVRVTMIGEIVSGDDVSFLGSDGTIIAPARKGWDHFAR